ncbi:hypothetical protein [Mycobacterium parmense]|uniref:Uncharacterized protein n=1 Tax=Mycobacterium parmense TaxID=185642 RepID=A0A7I7YSZ8_9MYCO|nr:hypothetical protein [Mycobacterium parmense]BBZ43861.1 hypothetical protein MPRM_11420 [Mycobacterium parmense]
MREIAGKIFMTREEAGAPPPSEEKLARAREMFDEFQRRVDAVADEDRPTEVSPKFWDDTSGTEYDPRRKS